MSALVFTAVLGAAIMHASWNAIAKAIPDQRVAAGMIGATYGRGFPPAARGSARLGLFGGLLALLAYAIVLWAQSLVPLALVSALRETSLLFAGVIGTPGLRRAVQPGPGVATAAAVAGIVLLQVG